MSDQQLAQPLTDFRCCFCGPAFKRLTSSIRNCSGEIDNGDERLVQRQALAGMIWRQTVLFL